jgi:hypothetical protein
LSDIRVLESHFLARIKNKSQMHKLHPTCRSKWNYFM